MKNINYILDIIKSWIMVYGVEVIKILALLIIGVWIINKLCRISALFLRRTNLDMGLISFFSSALKLFLRVVLLLLLFSIIGVNMTSIITAISASLVTIGLVLKDSLANFVSGLMIIVNKPIRVGDYIEFEDLKGTVTKIEMVFTTLNSLDGRSVIIPNFRLASNSIVRESPYDICEYSFGISVAENKPGTNLKKMLEILFISDERILQIPSPNIEYNMLADNQIDIKITLFCEKRYVNTLKKEIRGGIESALQKHGIKINKI